MSETRLIGERIIDREDTRTQFLAEYAQLVRKYDSFLGINEMPDYGIPRALICGTNDSSGFTFSFIAHEFSERTGRLKAIKVYRAKKKEWVDWITINDEEDEPTEWLKEKRNAAKSE